MASSAAAAYCLEGTLAACMIVTTDLRRIDVILAMPVAVKGTRFLHAHKGTGKPGGTVGRGVRRHPGSGAGQSGQHICARYSMR